MREMRMLFPGGKNKALTFSYDDGVEQDKRLVTLMRESGVKGTFNLNSSLFAEEGTVYPKGQVHRRMTKAQCLATYTDDVCEIAAHGATHPFLESVPTSLAALDVLRDRVQLEDMFSRQVRGMAYPYGTHSDALVDALRLSGIDYARTVHAHHGFALPRDWLRLGATCHHKDAALMELLEAFLQGKPREPWLFYLWGHAYEFEADDNWDIIERFLAAVRGREDVWFATNIEVYNACRAYDRLLFSADGRLVSNPSADTVWLSADGQTFSLAGGESARL